MDGRRALHLAPAVTENETTRPALTYAAAGVDIEAGDRLVARIRELAQSTYRPEVLGGVGSFGGLFRLGAYREPVLVSSTDSVGTKVKIASVLGRYDTLGVDLVNHCVNDVLPSGAEPLFFLDYIASSTLGNEEKLALVAGVASACREAGCALIGGETADLPDVYATGDLDLVGFIVGVVERDAVIDGSAIREGDVLLALPSSGLHTNGYSLVRRAFSVGIGGDPDEERARLDRHYPELDGTLGDALLASHRCYLRYLKPVPSKLEGIAHIHGGRRPGDIHASPRRGPAPALVTWPRGRPRGHVPTLPGNRRRPRCRRPTPRPLPDRRGVVHRPGIPGLGRDGFALLRRYARNRARGAAPDPARRRRRRHGAWCRERPAGRPPSRRHRGMVYIRQRPGGSRGRT